MPSSRSATLPSAAAGDMPVSHLPWEPQNFSGGRFVSRNEIDLPVELGPVKIVPYVLGELGYWGEDINGQPLTREYYQAGIRATLPMWAADSDGGKRVVERARTGPQGRVPGGILARPVEPEHDGSAALRSAGRPPDRRFPPPLHGRHVRFSGRSAAARRRAPPTKFDERFYAVRTDMEGWVTAPSMEIADDLDELRLGVHQRWQTKRGPADDPHIIDWVEFDTDITLLPQRQPRQLRHRASA